MKILITGASGRLGKRLRGSLGSEHELILISHALIDSPGTENYTATLDNHSLLTKIMSEERPDAIIHLSALVGPDCESNESLAKKINTEETGILAELATKHKIKKFIFASTAAVYRQHALRSTSEIDNVDPQTIYAKTKLAAEKTLANIAKTASTQFVVLRIFNIYGPDFEDSLINKLLKSSREQPVTLLGPDNCYRDYVHVDDVVAAIVNVLQTKLDTNFSLMNIASGVATSNTELVEALKLHGATPYFTTKSCDLSVLWADISHAREIINFKPVKSLGLKAGRL